MFPKLRADWLRSFMAQATMFVSHLQSQDCVWTPEWEHGQLEGREEQFRWSSQEVYMIRTTDCTFNAVKVDS